MVCLGWKCWVLWGPDKKRAHLSIRRRWWFFCEHVFFPETRMTGKAFWSVTLTSKWCNSCVFFHLFFVLNGAFLDHMLKKNMFIFIYLSLRGTPLLLKKKWWSDLVLLKIIFWAQGSTVLDPATEKIFLKWLRRIWIWHRRKSYAYPSRASIRSTKMRPGFGCNKSNSNLRSISMSTTFLVTHGML